jgi:hypothetical protein
MLRRLTLLIAGVVAVVAPLAASASIGPDNSYGTLGGTSVTSDCSGTTLKLLRTAVGYDGRVFVLEECASGYHRVFAVGNTGDIDSSYGVGGHATFQVPSGCRGEEPVLVPAKNGAFYALFSRLSAPSGSDYVSNLRVCIVRLTAGGTVVQFGGSSAVRHLDRLGKDLSLLTGGAVDDHGRLLVFTHRISSIWQDTAAFVNRYTLTGAPDRTFSADGQRAYTQPYQDQLQWGGVVGDKPVLAIRSYAAGYAPAPMGTALVRFDAAGNLDKTFSGDGKLYVRSADIGGARLVGGGIVVDDHKRITYVAQQGTPDHDALWMDLRRIGPTGADDAAFNAATTKVRGPANTHIPEPRLSVSAGKYILQWQFDPGSDPYRTTAFNGTGTRWTALGTNGTTKHAIDRFLPDRAAFYEISYRSSEDAPEQVELWRRLVQ